MDEYVCRLFEIPDVRINILITNMFKSAEYLPRYLRKCAKEQITISQQLLNGSSWNLAQIWSQALPMQWQIFCIFWNHFQRFRAFTFHAILHHFYAKLENAKLLLGSKNQKLCWSSAVHLLSNFNCIPLLLYYLFVNFFNFNY